MKTLAELMANGDFVIHMDDEVNNVRVEHSEEFDEWFQQTTGKEITEENLSEWFNETLRQALDVYDQETDEQG